MPCAEKHTSFSKMNLTGRASPLSSPWHPSHPDLRSRSIVHRSGRVIRTKPKAKAARSRLRPATAPAAGAVNDGNRVAHDRGAPFETGVENHFRFGGCHRVPDRSEVFKLAGARATRSLLD